MSLYTCLCTCLYTCVYACPCTRLYACLCTRLHICLCVRLHVYAHIYIHVYAHVYIHVHAHIYANVHAHIYTHVHTHVYTHVCVQALKTIDVMGADEQTHAEANRDLSAQASYPMACAALVAATASAWLLGIGALLWGHAGCMFRGVGSCARSQTRCGGYR